MLVRWCEAKRCWIVWMESITMPTLDIRSSKRRLRIMGLVNNVRIAENRTKPPSLLLTRTRV